MTFYKLEATGNDFIFFINQDISNIDIKKLCDRNMGIGADGIISIDDNNNLEIFNSDGSKAQLCGNGLRCACKLKYYLTNSNEHIFLVNNNKIETKMIDNDICYVSFKNPVMIKYKDNYLVNLINKHYIVICKDINASKFDEKLINLCNEEKTNIHIVSILNRKQVKMKTYEYGSKETLSCGSGSVAVFFCLNMLDLIDNNAYIIQNGGTVNCYFKNNKYYLKGPVNLLYKGELL